MLDKYFYIKHFVVWLVMIVVGIAVWYTILDFIF